MERPRPDGVRAAKVLGDGREVGEGPGERVEEPHGVARLVTQEQEALGGGLEVVSGELREVDAGAGAGGEVEEAAAVAVGAGGQHDPAARAEARVQVVASLARAVAEPGFFTWVCEAIFFL